MDILEEVEAVAAALARAPWTSIHHHPPPSNARLPLFITYAQAHYFLSHLFHHTDMQPINPSVACPVGCAHPRTCDDQDKVICLRYLQLSRVDTVAFRGARNNEYFAVVKPMLLGDIDIEGW